MTMTKRFVLVLVVLVLSLTAVGGVGLAGLYSAHRYLSELHQDNVLNTQTIVDLRVDIDDAHQRVLELIGTADPAARQRIAQSIVSLTIPTIEVGFARTIQAMEGSPDSEGLARAAQSEWAGFRTVWGTDALTDANPQARAAAAERATASLESAEADLRDLLGLEAGEADDRNSDAESSYVLTVRLTVVGLIAGLVFAGGALLWLIRSVLPRMLTYARVARRFADGDFSERLHPHGSDEIDQLGRTIDEVARRRESEDRFERTQAEFIEVLQVTADEKEAQRLLQRHLERTIPGSEVTVLNRNNSADRLEAVTELSEASPLRAGLEAAAPRSCLSVRTARPHSQVHGEDPLVSCTVCGGCPGRSTCTPLLVSGEVIGSVLINHEAQLDVDGERRIRDSVSQAAPVVANLRNLAIAQLRASTDALTGLPNRRGLQGTLRRMVAHASRTKTPLAALMIDLDHFKQINDRFGHGRGDEVLAAFGELLRGLLRESDFAARFGGEEFLVLLPATEEEGARRVAEKIRLAVRELRFEPIDRQITVSVGVALVPDHAADAESLERGADRALYAAKNRGRDRVEVANGKEPEAAGPLPMGGDIALDDDASRAATWQTTRA
jgi:diguanylate cyclase (GGDEF)-like protein